MQTHQPTPSHALLQSVSAGLEPLYGFQHLPWSEREACAPYSPEGLCFQSSQRKDAVMISEAQNTWTGLLSDEGRYCSRWNVSVFLWLKPGVHCHFLILSLLYLMYLWQMVILNNRNLLCANCSHMLNLLFVKCANLSKRWST